MAVRVAINGFGRTGRAAFRAAYEREADIEWVAINDVAEPAMLAQLLRHDTVYGPFAGRVEAEDGAIVVDGRRIPVPRETDPARLPWRDLGADIVIESTGRFRARADAQQHLEAGAEKVIVSAPAKEPDVTVALGVNFDDVYEPARTSHLQRLLHDELPRTGGEAAARRLRNPPRADDDRSCVHGRSATARRAAQGLPAGPSGGRQPRAHYDRRGEGARPRRSGAGRTLHGYAVRVPVPTGSLVDLTVEVERPTAVAEVNDALRAAARTSARSRASSPTARSRSSRPTSSSRRTRRSSTRGLTAVIDGTQVKVVAWYDNEWGYSNRLVDLAERVLVPETVAV